MRLGIYFARFARSSIPSEEHMCRFSVFFHALRALITPCDTYAPLIALYFVFIMSAHRPKGDKPRGSPTGDTEERQKEHRLRFLIWQEQNCIKK